MKPYKQLLFFFVLSVTWLTGCTKSDDKVASPTDPEPIDSFAWIDRYCGSYYVRVRREYYSFSSHSDTTYYTIVKLYNLRVKRQTIYERPYPRIRIGIDSTVKKYGIIEDLYIANRKAYILLFNELPSKGTLTNDSIIVGCSRNLGHGSSSSTSIEGIRIQ